MEINISNVSRSSQIRNALTSEKLTESNVRVELAITWLDTEKACFLNRTRININNEWVYVGNAEILEFINTKEGLKLLKENTPGPYLSAILAVWSNVQSAEESQKEIIQESKADD